MWSLHGSRWIGIIRRWFAFVHTAFCLSRVAIKIRGLLPFVVRALPQIKHSSLDLVGGGTVIHVIFVGLLLSGSDLTFSSRLPGSDFLFFWSTVLRFVYLARHHVCHKGFFPRKAHWGSRSLWSLYEISSFLLVKGSPDRSVSEENQHLYPVSGILCKHCSWYWAAFCPISWLKTQAPSCQVFSLSLFSPLFPFCQTSPNIIIELLFTDLFTFSSTILSCPPSFVNPQSTWIFCSILYSSILFTILSSPVQTHHFKCVDNCSYIMSQ